MAEKPTRSRPSRKEDAAKTEPAPAQETPKRKAQAKPKHRVFYEDTEGNLQVVGEFVGHRAEDSLTAYLDALDAENRQQAIDASTYAVDTNKGLVRLAATQTLSVSRR